MALALYGLDGRTDATHAALLVGHAFAVDGPVTLVRPLLDGDGELEGPPDDAAGLTVVEVHHTRRSATLGATVAGIEIALAHGRRVILDAPLDMAGEPTLTPFVDVAVATVGPYRLDGSRAIQVLAAWPRADDGPARRRPWFLACRSPGGPAPYLAHERVGVAPPARPKVLPVTLRPFTHDEAAGLVSEYPGERLLTRGRLLAAPLETLLGDPDATKVETPPPTAVDPDVTLDDGIRSLADDLARLRDGGPPDRHQLVSAPTLDDWRYVHRPRRVLSGRVRGHPTLPDGKRIVTTDMFASDGRTFARTLSSWWRLGERARGA